MGSFVSRLLSRPAGAVAAPVDKAPVPYVGRGSSGGGGMAPWLGGSAGMDHESELQQTRGSGALFGVIDRLAGPFSRVLWHLHLEAPGEKCEECGEQGQMLHVVSSTHPMVQIWNRPNEHFSGMVFRETYGQHLELTGEAYWFVVRLMGVPVELWPLRPDRLTPAKSVSEFLVGWWYTDPDGEKIPLLRDEVIQIRKPDPYDLYRGLSPIGALVPDLRAARLAAEWNAKFFENSAIPGGIIEYEERLGDHEFEEIVDRWRAMHQGTANAHRVGIVEAGKWVASGFSHKDMQFPDLAKLSGDAIREAYGFPKFAQGIVEDVNRASAEASDDFFAKWLILERLDRTRDALNNRLVPMFGTIAQGITYAYRSPVDGDVEASAKVLEAKTRSFVSLTSAGVLPVEAAAAVGLPAMGLDVVGGGKASPREIAEMVQKIYLGVDKVITWQESRQVLVDAGMKLDLSVPQPKPAPPAGGGFGAKPAVGGSDDLFSDVIDGEITDSHDAPVRGFLDRLTLGWSGEVQAREVPAELQVLQDDWTSALDRLERVWNRDIVPAWLEAIVTNIEAALEVNDPARLAVLDFAVDIQPATEELEQALAALELRAAERQRREAATQGVDVGAWSQEPIHNAEVWGQVAQAAAALLLSGYAQAAGREALRWWGSGRAAAEIGKQARSFLKGLSGKARRSTLGGLLSRAQNAGRFGVLRSAESAPHTPTVRYFASEILDGNTCNPCASIDGKRLPNLDAVLLAYGGDGGYLFCEGRERCRGTFVAKWDNEARR